jgi:hypothetical protein
MLHIDFGDHLHQVGIEDDHLVRVTGPDWESIDYNVDGLELEEDQVSFSDMSAALSLILGWACGKAGKHSQAPSVTSAGAKVHALLYLLDPVNARYPSLQAIADDAGMTKAAVSKSLAELRRQLGGILPMKKSGSREVYQRAQAAAIAAGVHVSQHRKDLKSKRAA